MSVCFVSNEGGTVQIQDDGLEAGSGEDAAEPGDTQLALEHFWEWVMEDIRKVSHDSFKNQVLPLARVKKIMKLDEEVKMISAEAPMLFAKASEIFIHELTLRAWSHTEDNKRRTLQRNDIAMAIIKSDQFDFLIDIVPRQELKPTKAKEEVKANSVVSQDQVHYYFQLAQQHQAALQSTGGHGPQILTPATLITPQQQAQQVQQQQQQQQASNSNTNSGTAASTSSTPSTSTQQQQHHVQQQQQQQQPLQIVQQVVTSTGEIQQVPIQLTPSQLHMIRTQMQNNAGQPIYIQTNPAAQQQLIQVQQPQPQQLYLTIASSENE